MADAYLGLRKHKLATKTVDEALTVATKLNERIEIAECYRIMGQLAAIAGNFEDARPHFEKAIEMHNMIGSRYHLAAGRYIAATSGAFANGEKNAMLHLAREYFQSEKVEHYLNKIQREISQPIRPAHAEDDSDAEPKIITRDPVMLKLIEQVAYIAPTQMPVLLTGPTGTGKDLMARYIHWYSGANGAFVIVNIAAIPESILEAELFGCCKGAFTGADSDRKGLIEAARDGTFYLNEIGEAPPTIQTKLLDVLERRVVRPLGSNTEVPVNFRLISATNRDLVAMVTENKFRADLYHRIRHIDMRLPKLTDRNGDIEPLTKHFLATHKVNATTTDSKTLADIFASRSWPGNVRELETEINRLAAMAKSDVARIIGFARNGRPKERDVLLQMINDCAGNRSEIARRLNMTEGAVRYRLQKIGLQG